MTHKRSNTLPDNSTQPLAVELRARGFIPLPKLWVKPHNIPEIHQITQQYAHEVNEIRAQISRLTKSRLQESDPRTSIDAAWASIEASQKTPDRCKP